MNSSTFNRIVNNAKEFCITHARPPTDLELMGLSGLSKFFITDVKKSIKGTISENYFNGMKNGRLSHDWRGGIK